MNTVTATYTAGIQTATAMASATTDLFQPGVDVTKNCSPDPIQVGQAETCTIVVTNTSSPDSPNLENGTIMDTLTGNLLDPGNNGSRPPTGPTPTTPADGREDPVRRARARASRRLVHEPRPALRSAARCAAAAFPAAGRPTSDSASREERADDVNVSADRLRDRTLALVEVESPTGDTADAARLYAAGARSSGWRSSSSTTSSPRRRPSSRG